MSAETQTAVPSRVECPAAKDPAVRMFIMAGILIGFGVWCFIEAYVLGKYTRKETLNEALNYYLNYGGGIAFPLAGLVLVGWGVRMLQRRLVADENGIGYVGRPQVPWSEITSMDASGLAKGILVLHHRADGGGTLVLDSWKLRNFRDLILLIETKVPTERA